MLSTFFNFKNIISNNFDSLIFDLPNFLFVGMTWSHNIFFEKQLACGLESIRHPFSISLLINRRYTEFFLKIQWKYTIRTVPYTLYYSLVVCYKNKMSLDTE